MSEGVELLVSRLDLLDPGKVETEEGLGVFDVVVPVRFQQKPVQMPVVVALDDPRRRAAKTDGFYEVGPELQLAVHAVVPASRLRS